MTPQIKKYTRHSRSYHDFFLYHELENYRIIFYHTEGHGEPRNNLCHEFANLRIISNNHTENHGRSRNNLSLSRIREFSNFLLITRNITESHGRQKFENSKITSLRSVGPRTSLGTKDKSRDKKDKIR